MTNLKKLAIIVGPDCTLDNVIRQMARQTDKPVNPGIAVVVDQDNHLMGVLTDGDIRRCYAKNIDFSTSVSEVMETKPVTIPADSSKSVVVSEILKCLNNSEGYRPTRTEVRHVIVTDADNHLVNIYDFFDLLSEEAFASTQIAVIGLGFVGLTLAVSLANQGHIVTGVDVRTQTIEDLNQGRSHIHEAGLDDMLQVALKQRLIKFTHPDRLERNRVYIVAVGTPLKTDGGPDRTAMKQVAETIGALLKPHDLVMLRSTVPVGITRNFFIPLLEEISGFKAGGDFHMAFTPERTVEGQAIKELRSLPQIVGGLTQECLRRAVDFWSGFASSVVKCESLEAAEFVKLANNSFRDLSFAFANELAIAADNFNIDAFRLIRAANEGYWRNLISYPSPGVGGYCLTKDPFLYSLAHTGGSATTSLSVLGRQVNKRAGLYVIDVLERFATRLEKPLTRLSVLLMGIAFKGEPETNDLRGSVAIDIADNLQKRGSDVKCWDSVVSPEELKAAGLRPISNLKQGVQDADAVLILNNHRDNAAPGIFVKITGKEPKLIFDGWSLLDRDEIERVNGLVYATMGYMSSH